MQIVLYTLGWIAVGLAMSRRRRPDIARLILGGLLLWSGASYHLWHFSRINSAAYGFGLLFLAQVALIMYAGLVRQSLRFQPQANTPGVTGASLIVFALVAYPLLNL